MRLVGPVTPPPGHPLLCQGCKKVGNTKSSTSSLAIPFPPCYPASLERLWVTMPSQPPVPWAAPHSWSRQVSATSSVQWSPTCLLPCCKHLYVCSPCALKWGEHLKHIWAPRDDAIPTSWRGHALRRGEGPPLDLGNDHEVCVLLSSDGKSLSIGLKTIPHPAQIS